MLSSGVANPIDQRRLQAGHFRKIVESPFSFSLCVLPAHTGQRNRAIIFSCAATAMTANRHVVNNAIPAASAIMPEGTRKITHATPTTLDGTPNMASERTFTRCPKVSAAKSGSSFIFFAERLRSDTKGSGAARSCLCRLVGLFRGLHLDLGR